jgi:hypothetical protein
MQKSPTAVRRSIRQPATRPAIIDAVVTKPSHVIRLSRITT